VLVLVLPLTKITLSSLDLWTCSIMLAVPSCTITFTDYVTLRETITAQTTGKTGE